MSMTSVGGLHMMAEREAIHGPERASALTKQVCS